MCIKIRTFAVALLAVAVAGCGAGGNGSGGGSAAPSSGAGVSTNPAPAVQKDEALAKLVPSDVASDGKIVVGSDASYAPNEFVDKDGTTIIGMDVDQKLGLEVEFQNSAFDGILPGIAAKKYELGMSSFTDNAEREKVVDMVTYFSAGTKMATVKGNPDGLNIDDLCGKTIAVQRGTVQFDDLTARSEKCTAAGKPAINQQPFQAQTDVTLALTGKRAQGMLADSPVVDYAVAQTNGQLEAVGEAYDTAPYGIAVPKNSGDYAKAVQGAVQALMTDGTYKSIVDKWSVSSGAITESKINGATG